MVYWLDMCSGGHFWLAIGRRDGVLAGHEQEMWYSDWTWIGEVMNWLNLGRRDGILTEHEYGAVVFWLPMSRRDGIMIGWGKERWYSDWIWVGDDIITYNKKLHQFWFLQQSFLKRRHNKFSNELYCSFMTFVLIKLRQIWLFWMFSSSSKLKCT